MIMVRGSEGTGSHPMIRIILPSWSTREQILARRAGGVGPLSKLLILRNCFFSDRGLTPPARQNADETDRAFLLMVRQTRVPRSVCVPFYLTSSDERPGSGRAR